MSNKVYEIITSRVIAAIENGQTAPWRKPWKGGAAGLPVNAVTGRPYSGMNVFMLGMTGGGRFLTFKQAIAAGGSVRKGEHGLPVVFYGSDSRTDSEGNTKDYRFLRYYTVFNVSQCDGLPPEIQGTIPDFQPNTIEAVAAADALVIGYQDRPPVEHRTGAGAFYHPAADKIVLPAAEQFNSAPEYYSTLFHELAHSTGHATRLDRDGIRHASGFASHAYSFEELVAEFTATYMMGLAGLDAGSAEANSASYLSGWLDRLKREPTWLVRAAAQAMKAANYMTGKLEAREAA